ncbi:hypothetical protein HT031_005666 [Scenedesmus sp. PABB004]|nr:hypothetical protein HT031_005666 [Scenedesmus sp. PABB004]
MLGGVASAGGGADGGGWVVLVLDAFTTRIISAAARMSDLLDAGVSVVEDLDKRREPLPLPAVYFITPSPASVARLTADFAAPPGLYPAAHVFFTNAAPPGVVDSIRRCRVRAGAPRRPPEQLDGPPPLNLNLAPLLLTPPPPAWAPRAQGLLPVLRSLKEVNLEFVVVDGRTWVTQHPHALVRLMGERGEAVRAEYEGEIDSIASRIATLLASLQARSDFPAIRYRAGKPPEPHDAAGAGARAELTQRLAAKVAERARALQRSGVLPPRESCDLLLLDRSVDPLAPVVHDWGYESLVHDLLPVSDDVIRYTAETGAGSGEAREHRLDDAADELWGELRHAHIADVYASLAKRMAEFQGRNKAAQYSAAAKGGASLSTSGIRGLIAALPQFREVLGRLGVHIHVSSQVKAALAERRLTELGEVEAGLLYGEAGSQELIKFLQDNGGSLAPGDKVRLLMSYVATHPERLEPAKAAQWAKLARLDAADMATVHALAFLNVAVLPRPAGQSKGLAGFALRPKKAKKALLRRRDSRGGGGGGPGGEEGGGYALARYDPALGDVVDEALAGRLSAEEYPYARGADDGGGDDFAAGGGEALRVASARTNRSAISWARRDGASGGSAVGGMGSAVGGMLAGLGLGAGSVNAGPGGGRRLVVFVVGGVTRAEMRAVHEAARRAGREVLLGSTSVLRPDTFLGQLRGMGAPPQ